MALTQPPMTLICGLVTDSVWSNLDLLYIFATENSPTALLNLTSSSYTLTVHNTPTFTADRGYQATCCEADNITDPPNISDWLETGFSAPAGQYSGDTAHLSLWNLTDAESGTAIMADGYDPLLNQGPGQVLGPD